MRQWEAHPYSWFHTAVSTLWVMSPAGKSGGLLDFKISRDLPDPLKTIFSSRFCGYRGLWLGN